MEMTANEIVRSYKEAKDKKKQVGILAQLNLCTPEDIKKILIEGGVDWRELPRGKRTPKSPPKLKPSLLHIAIRNRTYPSLQSHTTP